MKSKKYKDIYLQAITMIDAATGQIVSQAGVSPKLIKYYANYFITTYDVHTYS